MTLLENNLTQFGVFKSELYKLLEHEWACMEGDLQALEGVAFEDINPLIRQSMCIHNQRDVESRIASLNGKLLILRKMYQWYDVMTDPNFE